MAAKEKEKRVGLERQELVDGLRELALDFRAKEWSTHDLLTEAANLLDQAPVEGCKRCGGSREVRNGPSMWPTPCPDCTGKKPPHGDEGLVAERLLALLDDPAQLEMLWQEVRRRTRTLVSRAEVRASVEAALEPAWERAALSHSDTGRPA